MSDSRKEYSQTWCEECQEWIKKEELEAHEEMHEQWCACGNAKRIEQEVCDECL